jgi:hypothetical protein
VAFMRRMAVAVVKIVDMVFAGDGGVGAVGHGRVRCSASWCGLPVIRPRGALCEAVTITSAMAARAIVPPGAVLASNDAGTQRRCRSPPTTTAITAGGSPT